MAVVEASVTVATTATELSGGDAGGPTSGQSILVKVPAAGATVYLGGSGVTTTTGYPLAAGESFTADLGPGDTLFGIVVGPATQAVNVIRIGV